MSCGVQLVRGWLNSCSRSVRYERRELRRLRRFTPGNLRGAQREKPAVAVTSFPIVAEGVMEEVELFAPIRITTLARCPKAGAFVLEG